MILTGKTELLGGKPAPVPLFPPQIPHVLTQDRNRFNSLKGGAYSLDPRHGHLTVTTITRKCLDPD